MATADIVKKRAIIMEDVPVKDRPKKRRKKEDTGAVKHKSC